MRFSICFCVSDDGCATRSTSRSDGTGESGETELTSYCFLSSVTIDHSGFWPKVRMSNPPISLASVFRMPTFFRPVRETTRSERVSSYSTGRPRSKNGMTTSSRPEVQATPRMISESDCRASSERQDASGRDPEPLLGVPRRGRVELGLDQIQADPIAPPRGVFLEQADQVVTGLDDTRGEPRGCNTPG